MTEITNSTHKAEIVNIELLNHPNADTLSIVKVYGYQVCVRTEDWLGKTTACYLPPDTICPDTPPFEFLGTNKRIKAKKLRGVVSFGLLMPCPEGMHVGDDAYEYYGLTHYNPPEPANTGGEAGPAPKYANYSKYDVDSLRRYKDLFIPGEEVVATIKYHGCVHKDTLITTSVGSIRIEDLEIGTEIISYNIEQQRIEKDIVINKYISEDLDSEWVELELEDGKKLICTANHKILTNRGYVEACSLTDKDEIMCM